MGEARPPTTFAARSPAALHIGGLPACGEPACRCTVQCCRAWPLLPWLPCCPAASSIHTNQPTASTLPFIPQALNLFGNSGVGDVGAGVSSAPIVVGGITDAEVAASQTAQVEQQAAAGR